MKKLKNIIKSININYKKDTGLNNNTLILTPKVKKYQKICEYLTPFLSIKDIKDEIENLKNILKAKKKSSNKEELINFITKSDFIGFENRYIADISFCAFEFYPHFYIDIENNTTFINDVPISDNNISVVTIENLINIMSDWKKIIKILL